MVRGEPGRTDLVGEQLGAALFLPANCLRCHPFFFLNLIWRKLFKLMHYPGLAPILALNPWPKCFWNALEQKMKKLIR